jgi:hypothetical protein
MLSASVPAAATILAGVNLDRVRASPLRQQLPPAVSAILDSVGPARSALFASDGAHYLLLARGDFHEAPAGTILLAKGLAGSGSPDWLHAAAAPQGKARKWLLPRAESVAGADIWIVASGAANLPVSGNGENLNNLLHATQFTTLSVRLTDSVALEAIATCSAAEPARHLEETVRAFVHIGAGFTARQPDLSSLLRRINITRDDRIVHIALDVPAAELPLVLKLFGA